MAPAAIANAGASLRSHEAVQAGESLGHAAIDRGVEKVRDTVTTDPEPEDPDFQVLTEEGELVETTTAEEYEAQGLAHADIMGVVRVIGGAMIGIAVLVVVLNEIFSIESISNTTGPFGGVVDSLESTGVAALSLLVVGLLVAAANRVMGFFGGGGM